MLTDFTGADRVYIACGYTDLRRGIDGLAALVQQQFHLDPYRYPTWLMKTAKDADLSQEDTIQSLLPWNVLAECHAK